MAAGSIQRHVSRSRRPVGENTRSTSPAKVHPFISAPVRGPGRADLFWGGGAYAEMAAGHMRHEGRLYFLVLDPEKQAS